MPITEPAVGYGLALGLSFFHDKPQVVNYPGQPPRVIMPSITTVFGAGTENGTWSAGLGHIGVWNDGKIRYVGAGGYASLNLDWFGKGDSLGGESISYTNDLLFLYQKITFKLGDSDFFLGPQYRLLATDASFADDATRPPAAFPTASCNRRPAASGVVLAYDSLDQPFSPTRGVRAEVVVLAAGRGARRRFRLRPAQRLRHQLRPAGRAIRPGPARRRRPDHRRREPRSTTCRA